MKSIGWPTNSESHQQMRNNQRACLKASLKNPNENWMEQKLLNCGFSFTRQAQWGFRIFDFWCHKLGIAVEVDGPSHNRAWDKARDEHNYHKSGIVVLRVRNMNEDDANRCVTSILQSCTWNKRRTQLGLKPILNAD